MTGWQKDMSAIPALVAEGKTYAEIETAIGVTRMTIYKYVKLHGLKVARVDPDKSARSIRQNKIVEMFRQGVTLKTIGVQFGVSRQYIQTITAKTGMTGKDGGKSVGSGIRKAAYQRGIEARSLAKYGLPRDVVQQLQRDRVTHAYSAQVSSSQLRGVEWKLDFATWFAIWQTSGKLHLRGRGKGKYVMSRMSDAGCYELGNVHIQLATENSFEGVVKWRGKVKANRGVFLMYPGRDKAWWAKYGKKSLGFYVTEGEAVTARETYMRENNLTPVAPRPNSDSAVPGSAPATNTSQPIAFKQFADPAPSV